MTLRAAYLGDSAMWGQGLLEEHRFAHLAATRIAEMLGLELEVVPGPGVEPLRGSARSGAKINARMKEDEEDVDILLPSGGTMATTPGDRASFAMTSRSLFESNREMRAFLAGEDETPAARLFGENPATFPTVTDQVRDMAARATGPVQLVILDGGINDAEFEEVLDPEGPDIAKIDETIEQVFRRDLPAFLKGARLAFPGAVIVVTGYYSVLSDASDRGQLKALFEYLSGQPEFLLAINEGIQQMPVLREFLELLGKSKDVDALIEKAIGRSLTAAAHAHFRARQGIASLSRGDVGPGIVFAFPAFRPRHALFAEEPLVHQGYRPPGDDRHVVADEMLETRLASIPRLDLLTLYVIIRTDVGEVIRTGDELNEAESNRPSAEDDTSASHLELEHLRDEFDRANERLDRDLGRLLERTDLPSQLLVAARGRDLGALPDALDGEIGRIEIARIASFIHPTPAGARRYADRIVTAFQRHLRFPVREAVRGMAEPEERSARLSSLRTHGVDPGRGLRLLAPIAFIDSVAVQLSGLPFTPPLPFGPVPATTATMTLGPKVSFDVVIPLGLRTLLRAFDTNADIRLADITEIRLEGSPRFEELVLFLNGREFFRGRRDEARVDGETVTFGISA